MDLAGGGALGRPRLVRARFATSTTRPRHWCTRRAAARVALSRRDPCPGRPVPGCRRLYRGGEHDLGGDRYRTRAICVAGAARVARRRRDRYGRAFASAERSAQFEEPGVSSWVLPELIEAGVRTGRTAVAEAAVDRF